MSNPSLLCVPYRFKTSKLYSQIPDSGLGDFVVTRSASNSATRVNAAGLIETVADNVPRLDYPLGGITAGCPALLVEPSAQNICPRSQDIDLWSPTASITTPNAAISPNGTQNAELFVPNSGSTGRTEINIGTLTNATTYTMTCFMKQHTASLDQITLYVSDGGGATGGNRWGVNVSLSAFTLSNYTQSNGSVTSTSIENYGNGWYRIRVTGQVTSGMTSTSAVVIRYFGSTANGTNGVLVFGAQFELGSVATSYIPTAASPVTRGAETISNTGVSSLIGQTQGTIYCEFAYFGQPVIRSGPVYLRQAGARGLSINYSPSDFPLGISFISRNDGGSTSITIVSGALQIGTYYKIAIGYDAGGTAAGGSQASGVVAYVNGVQTAIGTLRVPDAAGLTEFRMYGANAGTDAEAFNGRIRAVELYPTRLPNTGPLSLQSLTQ